MELKGWLNRRAIGIVALVALTIIIAGSLAYTGYRLSHRPLLTPEQRVWLEQKGKLVIAGDYAFPPFEYIENGEYKGFNVDLVYSLALLLGVEVELRPMGWEEARRALKAGEIDAIQGMRYTPERTALYDFTSPYLQSFSVIVVPAGRKDVNGLEDLAGLRVAVQEGDVAHETLKSRKDINFIAVSTQEEGLKLLLEGQADAFVGNYWATLYNLKRLGATDLVRIADARLFPSPYCMAVRKGNTELLGILNAGLSALERRGLYTELYDKWFGARPAKRTFKVTIPVIFYMTSGALVLLLLSFITWNFFLRREVRKRVIAERGLRERLQALYQLSYSLPFLADEKEIAQSVMRIAREVVGLPSGGLWVFDNEKGTLIRLASIVDGENGKPLELPLDSDKGIVVAAFSSNKPIYVPDVREDSRYMAINPAALSELAIPVRVGGRTIGVLNGEKEQVDGFTSDERELLTALANQAAVALENVRLRRGLQEQLDELAQEITNRTLIQEIASLVASSLDVRRILGFTAAKMVEVFDVDHCGIVLFDTELMQGEVLAEYPIQGALGARIDLENYPAASYLIETKEPLSVPDIRDEPLLEPVRNLLDTLGIKSILLVPMVAQDSVLGSIGLDVTGEHRRFTPAEKELALAIAHQVAIGVQNARLYEDLQRRYYQMAALQDAVKALNSELNLKNMLNIITGICIGLLDADRSAILLFDEERKHLKCIVSEALSTPFISVLEEFMIWPPDLKEPPPPLVVNDVLKEPVFISIRGRLMDEGISSLMYLPLFHRGRLEGILCVFYDEPRVFSPGQVALAQTLADQAAIAIGNALLFQEVKKAGEDWESTFNAIRDGIAIMDIHHRILKVNKAFAELLDIAPEELIGRTCYEVLHRLSKPHPLCPAQDISALSETRYVEIEEPGIGRCLKISHHPMRDDKGRVTGMVVIYEDITEEKRLQEHLFQTEKLASLGRMAAGLAHELNNPLTTVVGYSNLLQKEPLPEKVKEGLREIEAQARRASSIVKAVLDFAEQRPPRRYRVNVNDLLERIISFQRAEVEGKGIRITTEFDPNLPETMGDPYQLEQVFISIITNAVQALETVEDNRRLTIRTSVITLPTDGGREPWIAIEFIDTGPGISEEHLHRIFEPFFTTKADGEGMGLALAYSIISRHKGHIRAENLAQGGARFIIELPIIEPSPLWAEKLLGEMKKNGRETVSQDTIAEE